MGPWAYRPGSRQCGDMDIMTKKKHYVSHYVPVPREAFAGVMGTLMYPQQAAAIGQTKRSVQGLQTRSMRCSAKHRRRMTRDGFPSTRRTCCGLAADLRSKDGAFSPPQVASIIAGDIDPSWKDE